MSNFFVAVLLCCSVFFLQSNTASDECSFLINELNTRSPANIKNREFVELKMVCVNERKIDSLQGYKVLGITIGSDSKKMTIDLIVNLWNERLKSDYYTIGAESLPNADIQPKSPYFTFRNKLTGNSRTMQMFFNKNDVELHAIAVVYKKGYTFSELILNSKKPFINIDSDIEKVIKENLVDLVVYGGKVPFEKCALFSNLCNDYADKNYILREFDNNKDRTLNRCSFDGIPFSPDKFKLGSPTPGGENDCTGGHFVLEQYLAVATSPNSIEAFDADNDMDMDHCTATFDASIYQNIDDDTIEKFIEEESLVASKSSCSALDLGANSGNIANEADYVNRKKRPLSETIEGEEEEESEYDTTKYFK